MLRRKLTIDPISLVANSCFDESRIQRGPEFGEGNAMARFYYRDCWFSGGVATNGARAAGRRDAGLDLLPTLLARAGEVIE